MNSLAIISLSLALSSLNSLGYEYPVGEGQISVNNRVGSVVHAPIMRTNGQPPLPGATAQVILVKANGTLVPIEPVTQFRGGEILEAHYYFLGITAVIPGVLPGEEATFRVRAWEGADWESATARGESPDVTCVVGGGLSTPPNLLMSGFTLFPRITLTLPTPESPAALVALQTGRQAEVTVEESNDLREWETILTRPVLGESVSFDVFASEQCRFYRLRPSR